MARFTRAEIEALEDTRRKLDTASGRMAGLRMLYEMMGASESARTVEAERGDILNCRIEITKIISGDRR